MKTKEIFESRANATPEVRQNYAAPKLKCFGAVGTLTQAGTGAVDEFSPFDTNTGRQML